MQVTIDRRVLEQLILRCRGPYSRTVEGVQQTGFWHRDRHVGPDDCLGCALEKALVPERA